MMLRINNIRVRVGAMFLLFAFPFLHLYGQGVGRNDGEKTSFKDRIAIRTNVVDWVLTTPNIAFDYDLVNTPYDKKSIGLGLKYNWNTSHDYIPKQVYNLFDMRFDYRFYWRQQAFDNRDNYYGDWEREWIKSAKGLGKLRARVNCFRAVENPKEHISFFVGPYLSFSSFSIKLNAADDALGRQGMAFGAGLTGGIALPLYGYENGSALDLEFGGSLGWHFASYDFYAADVVHNEYPKQGHRNRFVSYPLVTDVRVSLVYRFRSISKQHTEVNYDLIDRRYVARLMELDRNAAEIYNDSISVLKNELDRRNREIALYKETVESAPEFNEAFALEYLTPYMYMLDAPKQYIRQNKDTLPKIHIDSIEQITDPVMLIVRREIDSIPHVTADQIDKEFVNQYNNISDADGKKVNRTTLIRNIYTRLNSYIEDNNAKLVAGTFDAEIRSDKLYKYNPKQQGNALTEVTYKDSVRTVAMTENEKIEWLNSIKRKAWADVQMRMRGEYPGRVELPVVVLDSMATDSVVADSVLADSMMVDSALVAVALDSLAADSLGFAVDSLGTIVDSLGVAVDSIAVDSTHRVVVAKEKATKKKAKDKAKAKDKKEKASKAAKATKTAKAAKSKKSVAKADATKSAVDSIKVDSLITEGVTAVVALVDSVVVDSVRQTIASDDADDAKKEAKAKAKAKKSSKDEAKTKVKTESKPKVKAEDKSKTKTKTSEEAKSAKSAKRTSKSKKDASKEVVDSIKPDSIMVDSLSVELISLDSVPFEVFAMDKIGQAEDKLFALRSREIFIKEEDED